MMKQLRQIYLLSLLITGVTGCSTLDYYGQAIHGQLSLMTSGTPVDDLIADEHTDGSLRAKLQLSRQARDFARTRLHLPAEGAFTRYVELNQPWVVVNLVAVPEFSLTPYRWCYPILGCQTYRGYFHLEDALREQDRFRATGYDTLLGGVTAYSTLGWFDDPLHSVITGLPDERMVALLFHELAHRVLYIRNDTEFNESFATAVELEGLKLWLQHKGTPAAFASALERLQQQDQTQVLVASASTRLGQLYRHKETLPVEQLRLRKALILEKLRQDYNRLAEHWHQPGPLGTDPSGLNNANLVLFRQYHRHVNGFRQLLADLDYNFPAFYQAAIRLSRRPVDDREAALTSLSQRFDEHL